jgi:hypothetical protein
MLLYCYCYCNKEYVNLRPLGSIYFVGSLKCPYIVRHRSESEPTSRTPQANFISSKPHMAFIVASHENDLSQVTTPPRDLCRNLIPSNSYKPRSFHLQPSKNPNYLPIAVQPCTTRAQLQPRSSSRIDKPISTIHPSKVRSLQACTSRA